MIWRMPARAVARRFATLRLAACTIHPGLSSPKGGKKEKERAAASMRSQEGWLRARA
jgi:hypothetical protein